MQNLSSELVGLAAFFAGLLALAAVLMRFRDRLTRRFVSRVIGVTAVADLGSGARLAVVEAGGKRILVGMDRNGVQTMTVLGDAGEAPPCPPAA
jgi:flagellar biogenesis protein FliO